jgi:hypothetical protein
MRSGTRFGERFWFSHPERMVPVKKIFALLVVAFVVSFTVGCSDDKPKGSSAPKAAPSTPK